MSYIFLSQGKSIEVIVRLARVLSQSDPSVFDDLVVFVSSKRFYERDDFDKKSLDLFSDVIKEWDFVDRASSKPYSMDDLLKFEAVAGHGSFWEAVVSDRRMIYGRYCKVSYDPSPRFKLNDYHKFGSRLAKKVVDVFENHAVKGVISLVPVTLQETMVIKYAQGLNIPCYSFHSNRLDNFFTFYPNYTGSPDHILEGMSKSSVSKESRDYACRLIGKAADGEFFYEGVNLKNKIAPRFHLKTVKNLMVGFYEFRSLNRIKSIFSDLHDISHLEVVVFTELVKPLRYWLNKLYFKTEVLESLRCIESEQYSFFPLHAEPEVSLQVLGRPYFRDQLFLLRNIASSLPADEFLVVKEHPRALGMRPTRYYRDIVSIPNVRLVFDTSADVILSRANTVFTIAGTIGFEALMQRIPVVTFGLPKYSGLLKMATFEYCDDLMRLPDVISSVRLAEFSSDFLIDYVAAIHDRCIRVNLYSKLLGKNDRYSGEVEPSSDAYGLMAEHLVQVMRWKESGVWGK